MRKISSSYKVKENLDIQEQSTQGFVADRQDQKTPITTTNLVILPSQDIADRTAEEERGDFAKTKPRLSRALQTLS